MFYTIYLGILYEHGFGQLESGGLAGGNILGASPLKIGSVTVV